MAVVRLDNVHGNRGGQRLRQAVRLVGEEQAVRVHRRNGPLTIGVCQRLRQGAAATRHIVRNQCLIDRQVAVRVKTLNQLSAVVVQVAFDGVAATRLTQRTAHSVFAAVLLAAEAVLQFGGAAVGGVRDTARQSQTGSRCRTGIVVATGKVRIRTNRNVLSVGPGNLLRRSRRTGGNDRASAHQLGVSCRPLQGASTTEGTTNHVAEARHAQCTRQTRLRTYRVANAHLREAGTPVLTSARVALGDDARRTGRTVAAAQNIGSNHEVAVGVHDRAGAHDAFPPAVRFDSANQRGGHVGGGYAAGDMRVTGERVQDQDGVITSLVEGAPGFVADGDLRQGHAGLELQVADVQLTQVALRFRVFALGARHGDGCGDRLAGSAGLGGAGLASALGGHGVPFTGLVGEVVPGVSGVLVCG